MLAGDNSRRSKDRNCRRLSLAKTGQRLSGSDARRLRAAKIDIDLETSVAMGIAAVVTTPRKRWRQPVRRTQKWRARRIAAKRVMLGGALSHICTHVGGELQMEMLSKLYVRLREFHKKRSQGQ